MELIVPANLIKKYHIFVFFGYEVSIQQSATLNQVCFGKLKLNAKKLRFCAKVKCIGWILSYLIWWNDVLTYEQKPTNPQLDQCHHKQPLGLEVMQWHILKIEINLYQNSWNIRTFLVIVAILLIFLKLLCEIWLQTIY